MDDITVYGGSDSCHCRCSKINKIYILNSSYCVAKLLQYSGSRFELRDGFSLRKMIYI